MARGTRQVLCGTPSEYCTGTLSLLSNSLKAKGYKSHQTSEQAFNCCKKALIMQGYTQVDSRAFQPPGGGPIRVLTKKSRFGGITRRGKEGLRSIPTKRLGGICISK